MVGSLLLSRAEAPDSGYRTPAQPSVRYVRLARADALSCAGHPLVRARYSTRSRGMTFVSRVLRERGAMRTGSCVALYGDVSAEPSRCRERDAARRSLRQRRARRRRAGYGPVLFGYADQGVDPETVVDRDDPRRSNYEGLLPGFDAGVELDGQRRRRQSWRSQEPTR